MSGALSQPHTLKGCYQAAPCHLGPEINNARLSPLLLLRAVSINHSPKGATSPGVPELGCSRGKGMVASGHSGKVTSHMEGECAHLPQSHHRMKSRGEKARQSLKTARTFSWSGHPVHKCRLGHRGPGFTLEASSSR